jgi:hypothetical protein
MTQRKEAGKARTKVRIRRAVVPMDPFTREVDDALRGNPRRKS